MTPPTPSQPTDSDVDRALAADAQVWNSAIEAAAKAICPACRAGVPLGAYAYYRHDVPSGVVGVPIGPAWCTAEAIWPLHRTVTK